MKEKYRDETLSFKERAEDMVSRMTVEECASQMLFGAAKIERLGAAWRGPFRNGHCISPGHRPGGHL